VRQYRSDDVGCTNIDCGWREYQVGRSQGQFVQYLRGLYHFASAPYILAEARSKVTAYPYNVCLT